MLKELNEKGIGKYINLEKWGLSTFELKILAILAMFNSFNKIGRAHV